MPDDALYGLNRHSSVAMSEDMRGRAVKVNSAPYALHHTAMDGQRYRFAATDDEILFVLWLQILPQLRRNGNIARAALRLRRADHRIVAPLRKDHIPFNMDSVLLKIHIPPFQP